MLGNFGAKKLPVVQQAEGAECGLVCLVMIANYFGHRVDLIGLRQKYPPSRNGARLSDLLAIAHDLQLETRAVRVDLEQAAYLNTPCMLHWDLTHFVVLKKIRNGIATIHDPALGVRTLSMKDLSRHMTGVAVEFTPREDFAPQTSRRPTRLSDVWGRPSGLLGAVSHIVIISIVVQLLALVSPLLMQIIVDQISSSGSDVFLAQVIIGFGVVALFSAIVAALRSWVVMYYSSMLNFQMVARTFTQLLRLPATFFESRHVGDVLSRMNSARSIQTILTEGLATTVIDGLLSIVTLTVVFVYSPTIGVVVVVTTLMMFLANEVILRAIRVRQEESLVATANEQSHMMESVRAAPTIKLFAAEIDRVVRWKALFSNVVNASLTVGKLQIALKFTQDVLAGTQFLLVVYIAASSVIANEITMGMLVAVVAYRQAFAQHAGGLLGQMVQFKMLSIHLDRLGDIVHNAPDRSSAGMGSSPAIEYDADCSVVFEDVSFRYSSTDPFVFRNVSFVIPSGSFAAITGPSGSGKTTIFRIILGLLEPTDGQVLLGGRPLNERTIRHWREQSGVVLQNDKLFSGTIADNIAFFDPQAKLEDVRRAAQAAAIDEHVAAMPMGYQSLIGDMGSTLSAGQQQRVLLARALYRRPSLLMLDEGTANLDPANEAVIADVIAGLQATRIVVAHRPALINKAGMVLDVSEGKVLQVR